MVLSDTFACTVNIFARPCWVSHLCARVSGVPPRAFTACPREQHWLSFNNLIKTSSAEPFLQLLVWISCFGWGENRILIWLRKNQNSDFYLPERVPWTDKSTGSSLWISPGPWYLPTTELFSGKASPSTHTNTPVPFKQGPKRHLFWLQHYFPFIGALRFNISRNNFWKMLRVWGVGVVRQSREGFDNARCVLSLILRSKELGWGTGVAFPSNLLWLIRKSHPFLHPTELLCHEFPEKRSLGASDEPSLMVWVWSPLWIGPAAHMGWFLQLYFGADWSCWVIFHQESTDCLLSST